MRGLLGWLCIIVGISPYFYLVPYYFKAYFMIKVGDGGVLYDGLGRELYEAPFFLQYITSSFAGWKYLFIDLGMFWVAALFTSALFKLSGFIFKPKESHDYQN